MSFKQNTSVAKSLPEVEPVRILGIARPVMGASVLSDAVTFIDILVVSLCCGAAGVWLVS